MKTLHPDFLTCSTERSEKVQWSKQLFELATQEGWQSDSRTEVTVPFNYDDTQQQAIECILRSLYPTEITTLETTCHCKCNDWSKIRLLQRVHVDDVYDLSQQLPTYVSGTRFHGTVVLMYITSGRENHAGESEKSTTGSTRRNRSSTLLDKMIPVGIHGCTAISNSMIHINTSKVFNCNVMSHTYVDSYSIVMNCTYIAMSSPDSINCYNDGDDDDNLKATVQNSSIVQALSVSVGAESGGSRSLRLVPETTMIHVSQQIVRSQPTIPENYHSNESHATQFNIIGSYCIVRDTPTLFGVYLHPTSSIIAATSIEQALLFPGSKICNACTVRNTILQWNCTITDHSYVSDVFFMEQAIAGPQSTVTNSILGPDVHVSCGEVHASVFGPNTNAHHQSLVISTLWMCGRGNVGYGSNVGSNHTGRIPDQECCAGEGIFWGLSCIVKFPVDLSCAPYTIVAAGTTLVPQRCTMPFSLIVNTTGRSSSGGTDIIPGWVLRYSPYTIVRSEQKFAQRRKAKRHMDYTGWKIIRPDIVHLCHLARQELFLSEVTDNDDTVYSERSVPGIGANQLTEKGRLIGIQAYSELIQQFSLQGLYTFLVDGCEKCSTDAKDSFLDFVTKEFRNADGRSDIRDIAKSTAVRWPSLPWDDDDTRTLWQSQRHYLLEDFPLTSDMEIWEWIKDLMAKHIDIEMTYCDRIRQCKQRDDGRGAMTIPGYTESHIDVDRDAVVISIQKEFDQRQQDVDTLLTKLVTRTVKS